MWASDPFEISKATDHHNLPWSDQQVSGGGRKPQNASRAGRGANPRPRKNGTGYPEEHFDFPPGWNWFCSWSVNISSECLIKSDRKHNDNYYILCGTKQNDNYVKCDAKHNDNYVIKCDTKHIDNYGIKWSHKLNAF